MEENESLYWDSNQSSIRLQIGTGTCAVRTADAVATGDVNCHDFISRLCLLPWFAETISQGYCSAAQTPLASEDGPNGDSNITEHVYAQMRILSGDKNLQINIL